MSKSTRIYKGWSGEKYGTNRSNKWLNILIFGIPVEKNGKEHNSLKNMLTYTHTHVSIKCT